MLLLGLWVVALLPPVALSGETCLASELIAHLSILPDPTGDDPSRRCSAGSPTTSPCSRLNISERSPSDKRTMNYRGAMPWTLRAKPSPSWEDGPGTPNFWSTASSRESQVRHRRSRPTRTNAPFAAPLRRTFSAGYIAYNTSCQGSQAGWWRFFVSRALLPLVDNIPRGPVEVGGAPRRVEPTSIPKASGRSSRRRYQTSTNASGG